MQHLAAASGPIPELTTACEDLRAALTASLNSSINVIKASIPAASPAHTAPRYTAPTVTPTVTPVKSQCAGVQCATVRCSSPSCHHVAQLQMTGHQGGTCCSSGSCCEAAVRAHSPCCHVQMAHSCMRCSGGSACCCSGLYTGAAVASGRAECSALLSGRLFDVGLTPAASKLQVRIEQLDRDIR